MLNKQPGTDDKGWSFKFGLFGTQNVLMRKDIGIDEVILKLKKK
jgi:hypothetical protein